jgi:signal transduction histidine kinase
MKTILIIDDNFEMRQALHETLEEEGFRVISADNGTAGMQLAKHYLPDVIVCDIHMSDVSGYEVLVHLQQQTTTANIPFIFLTAKARKADVRRGMALGADDYLIKPVAIDDLLRAIARRLEKKAIVDAQSKKQLDELRSNIFLYLPHELWTPITGIFTSVELLRLEADDPTKVLELADTIQLSTNRLNRLIQKFLLYTRLEIIARDPVRRQQLQIGETYEPQVLIETIANQLAQQTGRAADLQLNLTNVAIAFPAFELEKVIYELLDNAFKFGKPTTPIQLTTWVEADQYTVMITNYGQGMSPEQIARVGACLQFDRHYYEQQGMGLGLAIVQRLLELYGGRLEITSIPHQQTTVSVTFACLAD